MRDRFIEELICYSNLKTISNVDFTPREIDIIACVVRSRSTKKIAAILLISPRTVEANIYNITSKLRCGSRDAVIDFVENSNEFSTLRQHYDKLVLFSKFFKIIKRAARIIQNTDIVQAFFNLEYLSQEHLKYLDKILVYLKAANINLLTQQPQKASDHQNSFFIYPVSGDKESLTPKIISEHHVSLVIFFDAPFQLNQKTKSLNAFACDSIYILTLNILEIIQPKNEISLILNDFYTEYQILRKNSASDNTISDKKTYNKSFFNLKNKIIALTATSIFFIILLFFYNKDSKENLKVSDKALSSWNIPNTISYFTDRKELSDSIWNKFKKGEDNRSLQVVGLYGLAGVGKTSLASSLINNPQKDYEFKVWFNAETQSLLKSSFFELGEGLHLFSDNLKEELKIRAVKNWLDAKKSVLIVFDNVSEMKIIKDFMPAKGDIIITSKNYKVSGALEVGKLKKTEALNLLNKIIPDHLRKSDSYNQESEKLISELGCFPLALSQAAGYINTNKCTINKYLELYKSNKVELLTENSLPAGDHHDPSYIAWDISRNSLLKKPDGEKALKLLNFIGYLYHENIPKKLLVQYFYKNHENKNIIELNKILNLLREYSLISITSENISIHKLIHDWSKAHHDKDTKSTYLKEAINCLQSIYPKHNLSNIKHSDDYRLIQALTPHMESLYVNFNKIIPKKKATKLLRVLGQSYNVLGEYHKSKRYLNESVIYSKEYFGLQHKNTAKCIYGLGIINQLLGNYIVAKNLLEESLGITKKSFAHDSIQVAQILYELGWVYNLIGDYTKSKKLLDESLFIKKKHYGHKHIEIASNLFALGWIHFYLGDYSYSQKLLKESLSLQKLYSDNSNLEVAKNLYALSWANMYAGDYREAKIALEQSLLIHENYYGSKHLSLVNVLQALGWVNIHLGYYLKAKNMLERSLEIRKKIGEYDQHVDTSHIIHALGWAEMYLGYNNKALKLFHKSLDIRKQWYGYNHIKVAYVLNSLGVCFFNIGNTKKSEEMFKASTSIVKNKYGENHIVEQICLANLGAVYLSSKRFKECKEILENSIERFRNFYGEDSVNHAITMANLGLLYGALNDEKKKKKYLKESLIIFKKKLSAGSIHIMSTEQNLRETNNIFFKGDFTKLSPYFCTF